jgi:isopentenyldiphosphate isomerase
MMETLYPKNLLENLTHNNVVPFIGSGMSRPSGLPLWNDLIQTLIKEIEDEYDVSDLRRLYEQGVIDSIDTPELYSIISTNKFPLLRFIKSAFDKPWRANSYHKLLSQFEFDTILTTNFDNLIENQYEQQGVVINRIWKSEHLPFFDEKRFVQLIKIHGTIDDIKSIVLAKSDYDAYRRRNKLIYHLVSTIFLTRTILFLGFSLQDPNILNFLDEIKNTIGDVMRTHYALLINPPNSLVNKLSEYGIRVIKLPDNNIEQNTLDWLEGLLSRASFIGESNLDKARMINDGLRYEIENGLPGSIIRMRASLGIISNPKESSETEPIYGSAEQDKLEVAMGMLARQLLRTHKGNKIRCILHIDPELQQMKGYKKRQLIKRLLAMREFLDEFGGQVEIAHSPIPIDLNHVIVADRVSYITLQWGRETGYQRIHMKQNRWIVRSEVNSFDNDFDSLRLFNSQLAEKLDIDVDDSEWPHRLSIILIDSAIRHLESKAVTVLESDASGAVVGMVGRDHAHTNEILHKSVHLHLIDRKDNKVWLQRRTKAKDLWEGMIDVAVAGHQETGDDLAEVLRETAEELGVWIHPDNVLHLFQYERRLQNDHELINVYCAEVNSNTGIGFNFKSEVDSVMRVDLNELRDSKANLHADGYICFASMKLPARFKISTSEFVPGLIEELNKVYNILLTN